MGLRDYADYYRFGSSPAVLIHYTGGTISREQHAERSHSEPTPIVDELRRVLKPTEEVHLLVSPAPPAGDEPRDEPLEAYLEYVIDVLLPEAGLAPEAIGFAGYSFGGHLATYLAATEERARGLAVFGGVGVLEAAREAGGVVSEALKSRFYRNADDPVPDPGLYVGRLPAAMHARAAAPLRGGHPFVDYAANGTVREVFRFLLDALTAR